MKRAKIKEGKRFPINTEMLVGIILGMLGGALGSLLVYKWYRFFDSFGPPNFYLDVIIPTLAFFGLIIYLFYIATRLLTLSKKGERYG